VGSDSSHSRIRELNHSALGGLAISEVPGLPFTGYRRFLDRGDGHHVLLLPTSLAVANSGDDGGDWQLQGISAQGRESTRLTTAGATR